MYFLEPHQSPRWSSYNATWDEIDLCRLVAVVIPGILYIHANFDGVTSFQVLG